MSREIVIALVVIILLIGGFLLMRGNTTAPVDTETPPNTDTNTDINGDDNGTVDTGATVDTSLDLTDAPDVTVDVTGQNFTFSTKEIRVKQGDTVRVNFTSTEGTHDWKVDEFNAQTAMVQAGGSSSTTFVADKKGTFEYYCSVGTHRQLGMVGKLIVE